MTTPESPEFLTVPELAKALRVSKMTIYRLIYSSELPAVRVGHCYRLQAVDVDRYLRGETSVTR